MSVNTCTQNTLGVTHTQSLPTLSFAQFAIVKLRFSLHKENRVTCCEDLTKL